ncbi:hypothetical protein AAD001_00770 [Colwelliaceae bacterium 6471]
MTQQMITEKREKTLAEQIMVIVMFALMMAGFISYFLKQETQITSAGFRALANSFATKVIAVRSQWFMDKKPNFIILTTKDTIDGTRENSSNQKITVNKKGWIDVSEDNLACEKIWQLTMNLPLNFIKSPIATVEVKNNAEQQTGQGRICRYSVSSTDYFEYHTGSGKVIFAENQ